MAKSADNYTIQYEGFYDVADEIEHVGENLEGVFQNIAAASASIGGYHAVYHQLNHLVVENLAEARKRTLLVSIRMAKGLAPALRAMAQTVEACERDVCRDRRRWGGNAAVRGDFATEGFANGFYERAREAKAAKEQADNDAKDAQRKADEKKEWILAFLATYFPETYAKYQQRLHEAEEEEFLSWLKENDPELYKLVMAEKERQKAAAEAAAKAAEEAEKALGELGADAGSSGGGADVGWGSDAGGGGGSGWGSSDLGSDWGGSDWASDLLDDNIDSDELFDAGSALGDIVSADPLDALQTGVNAFSDEADLGEGASGLFGAYGPQLVEMAQRYGVQAGLALGGGALLYATREQTTEAVAHVAEFVSTRCKPAVADVMDQVGGVAKSTRVKLSSAKSGVTAPVRTGKAGDLLG